MAKYGDIASTIKQQADIVRVVGEYVKLTKSGAQNFSGVCPFHKEKTGSFSVHISRQFYHCFGCGDSGDVFTFIQKIENISFSEAVRFLADKLGIPVPTFENSPEEAKKARQRAMLVDIHNHACSWFEAQLLGNDGAAAREYLKSRGIDEAIMKSFRIGYAPEQGFALKDELQKHYVEGALRASGIFGYRDVDVMYCRFRNRIMFPICNEQGKVIAFTGRTLDSNERSGPKYLNSPETMIYSKSHALFNIDKAKDAIRRLEYAIIVEGQMDCISVFSAGLHNVIASSGTAFTDHHARSLSRFARNAVVNFDPDAAGGAATERSFSVLTEHGFQIKVLTLDKGYDPDLFIRTKGKDAYIAELRESPRYFDYLIERALEQFPSRDPNSKVKAINLLLPHVQRVQNPIVRDELSNQIAQKLEIDSNLLRKELKSAATELSSKTVNLAPICLTSSEKSIIAVLAGREFGQRSAAN